MGFNGSGTFGLQFNWVDDRQNNVRIQAERMQAEFEGVASGLSTTILRDGTSSILAPIPWNNQRITGLADATADQDALNRQAADARYARLNSGLPVGTLIVRLGSPTPPGFIKGNGALLSRTTYADLWAFAQSSGMIVNDTTWLASDFGRFSFGDGSSTFRIPLIGGEFIRIWDDGRGLDSGRALGTVQADAVKEHSHNIGSAGVAPTTGVEKVVANNPNLNPVPTSGVFIGGLGAGATENRVRNIAYAGFIKF